MSRWRVVAIARPSTTTSSGSSKDRRRSLARVVEISGWGRCEPVRDLRLAINRCRRVIVSATSTTSRIPSPG